MIFVIFGVVGLAGAATWWLYAQHFADPVPTAAQVQTDEAQVRHASACASSAARDQPVAVAPFYIGYFALPYCQYTWLPQYLTHYCHIRLVQASLLSSLPFIAAFLAVNFAGWGMDWLAANG
jgi:hypothetical protein